MQMQGRRALKVWLVSSASALALSLTFNALAERPFCPCQCSSIDDQDNYKPVNQQPPYRTDARSSRDLSHEYYICIPVTILKAPLHKRDCG